MCAHTSFNSVCDRMGAGNIKYSSECPLFISRFAFLMHTELIFVIEIECSLTVEGCRVGLVGGAGPGRGPNRQRSAVIL